MNSINKRQISFLYDLKLHKEFILFKKHLYVTDSLCSHVIWFLVKKLSSVFLFSGISLSGINSVFSYPNISLVFLFNSSKNKKLFKLEDKVISNSLTKFLWESTYIHISLFYGFLGFKKLNYSQRFPKMKSIFNKLFPKQKLVLSSMKGYKF